LERERRVAAAEEALVEFDHPLAGLALADLALLHVLEAALAQHVDDLDGFGLGRDRGDGLLVAARGREQQGQEHGERRRAPAASGPRDSLFRPALSGIQKHAEAPGCLGSRAYLFPHRKFV
jgi:hypothetical protein